MVGWSQGAPLPVAGWLAQAVRISAVPLTVSHLGAQSSVSRSAVTSGCFDVDALKAVTAWDGIAGRNCIPVQGTLH